MIVLVSSAVRGFVMTVFLLSVLSKLLRFSKAKEMTKRLLRIPNEWARLATIAALVAETAVLASALVGYAPGYALGFALVLTYSLLLLVELVKDRGVADACLCFITTRPESGTSWWVLVRNGFIALVAGAGWLLQGAGTVHTPNLVTAMWMFLGATAALVVTSPAEVARSLRVLTAR